jgi:hypothetical protein
MYRELVKGAIKRTHDDLQSKAAAAAQEKKAARSSKTPVDPLTAAKRERDAQLRELTDQAHGANLDLGVALINGLAAVDPDDIDVARFFALCGCPHRANYADRLTMRISRCDAVREETTTRLDVAPPKHAAVAPAAGRRTDSDAPRWTASTWLRWRAQRRAHARNRRRSGSHPAAARRFCRSS